MSLFLISGHASQDLKLSVLGGNLTSGKHEPGEHLKIFLFGSLCTR